MLLNLTNVAVVFLVSIMCSLSCLLDCNTVAEALHRGRYHRAQVYGQSVINFDGTVGKSLAAVIRVPREQPRTEADWASLPSSARSNEMPKDEPDTTPSSGPSNTVRGVVGFNAELVCDVEPKVPDDQLQLVLWYKKGHKSPIYTFDARDKSRLTYAHHFSPIYGQRASLRLPDHDGQNLEFSNTPGGSLNSKKQVAVLVLSRLRPDDEGIYKCRADFKRSPTKNNRMYLDVLMPPKKPIIHDANGRKMTSTLGPYKVGEKLIATCVTSADEPLPTLTWWRNEALIDDTYEVINNETTNILTINRVERKDLNSIFTCQALSQQLDIPVSTQVRLDLTFPPLTVSIEVDNSKRPLVAGKEAKVECKCKGSRPTPLFRWFVGSRELDTSSKNDKMAEEHHETAGGEWTSSIIRFLPKAEDNGKTILCKVTNEYFPDITKEDSLILNIHYVPMAVVSFGRSLNPKNILEGADVYFECHVKSNPPFYNITWRNNGKFLIENVSEGVIVGNQTLALQKVTREDAGLYTCVASNREGDGESNAQYLDIKFAPECKTGQRIIYGAAFKSEVMVSCYVEANPMPHSFKWQFKTASKRRRTDLINTVGGAKALDKIKDMVDLPANQFTLEYDHSLLRYRTMTEADYGFLYCWAENLAGQQREPCRYEIVRESAPDPPKYCQPLNVTWERIEAACQSGFDGGHFPTFHCEVYKSEASTAASDEDTASSSSTLVSSAADTTTAQRLRLVYNLSNSEAPEFMLDGLEAGAEYHIVVYASNMLGKSPKMSFNATTLNMAEKRTAETRSKLSPITDPEATKINHDQELVDHRSGLDVDPGLAILPIIAILCGVAIGLGSVALGLIFVIRGRTDEDHSSNGGGSTHNEMSGDESSARYDPVETMDLRTSSVVGVNKSTPERYRGVPVGCEQREYLQIAGGVGASGNNCSSNCGSLHRRHHPIGSDQGGRNSSGGGGTTSAQQPPRRITTTHIHGGSGAGHNHGTLNRGGGGCPNSADHPSLLRRSSSGTTASSGIRQHGGGGLHHQQQQIVGTLPRSVRFEDVVLTAPVTSESHGLLDHDSMPLPLQPPATFSDPPPPPPEQQPPQLSLRPELRLQPLATNENAVNHESSFVTFCPPSNLETKARDVVNATRL